MLNFDFMKLTLISAVALIVLGPEKLPYVARTIGRLFNRAQKYANNIKSEISRTIELDELRTIKNDFENHAKNFQSEIQDNIPISKNFLESSINNNENLYLTSNKSELNKTENFNIEKYKNNYLDSNSLIYNKNKKWRIYRNLIKNKYIKSHSYIYISKNHMHIIKNTKLRLRKPIRYFYL